ncbi:serpin family protein [Microlunatus sp. GCM10028923]|uniref:serpin family protein n=1 Tax=Microlunatus sp. GCM10028923 TaxID=3273400 RepID=UPI00360E9B7B
MTGPVGLGFVTGLHALIAAADSGNLAWSPYSVTEALRLALAGAAGRTRDELAAVLDDAPGGVAFPEGVRVANTVWADTNVPIKPSYDAAALHLADFAGDPEGARVAINADVEKTTAGLIQDLLGPGTVDGGTLAVLVNALHLRLRWLRPFERSDTRPLPFHTPAGTRDVPTMTHRGRLEYGAAAGWQLVTYVSRADSGHSPGDLVLDVLLPDDELTAPSAADLKALYGSVRPEQVDLRLPRFDASGSALLAPPLRRLGLRTLFTDDADLSGLSDVRIKISEVIHRAVLTVDEEGAEGAAATAMIARAGMAAAPPIPVHVDRPFLAIIRDRPSGAVLFLARITAP